MTFSVQIMLPIVPKSYRRIYYKGYVANSGTNIVTIYITRFSKSKFIMDQNEDEKDVIYGCCGDFQQSIFNKKIMKKLNHLLILKDVNKPQIDKLVINGRIVDGKDRSIIVFYDYDRISESEVEWEYSDNLPKLQQLIQNETSKSPRKTTDETVLFCPSWLTSSMFIQHVINYLNMVKWLVNTSKQNKKVSFCTLYTIWSILKSISPDLDYK